MSESSKELTWHSTKCKRNRTCLKCGGGDGGGGKVLVCETCPIEIHDRCMNCPAQFDATGRFHCPYCSYNQSAQECERAKEKVMMVKEAISYLLRKGHEFGQNSIVEGWIVKLFSLKLERQKRKRALQSNRSNMHHDEIDGLVMHKESDTSASDDSKQIQQDEDTVFANQACLEGRVCKNFCFNEPTDMSCEVEQEKIAEKDISKALEVEKTIQVNCSILVDSYQEEGNTQDKEKVQQPDNLCKDGWTCAEPVVHAKIRKNNDVVKNSGQSSLMEGKELKVEQTQEESQGSCLYPVRKRRVTKICGKPDDLDDNCSSYQDHHTSKRRGGYRNGARDGRIGKVLVEFE
ncbi:hypothetical protein Droror1_Dr00019815 [Drosera rotundifolia]